MNLRHLEIRIDLLRNPNQRSFSFEISDCAPQTRIAHRDGFLRITHGGQAITRLAPQHFVRRVTLKMLRSRRGGLSLGLVVGAWWGEDRPLLRHYKTAQQKSAQTNDTKKRRRATTRNTSPNSYGKRAELAPPRRVLNAQPSERVTIVHYGPPPFYGRDMPGRRECDRSPPDSQFAPQRPEELSLQTAACITGNYRAADRSVHRKNLRGGRFAYSKSRSITVLRPSDFACSIA